MAKCLTFPLRFCIFVRSEGQIMNISVERYKRKKNVSVPDSETAMAQ